MPAALKEHIELVNERIEQACQRAGRSSSEVKLVAVTKMTTVEMAKEALRYGLHSLGENRVQDFIA
ncbi:MAG TPA: YggS family pyridoxal phosphate enzyme, partial [Peptococcaceae bacterium]|nr:YggS family pyridoxal phosphate enzyme [Peptococcaceae bacterium]